MINYKKNKLSASLTLDEILASRDFRSRMQKQLIEKYKLPLIVFTLNIVGPVKAFSLARKTFYEGLSTIKKQLVVSSFNIVKEEICEKTTGYEAYLVVDGDVVEIKQSMLEVEEASSLGRLFDIDVIDTKLNKLSRANFNRPFRKCLICNNAAFECSRSRKHEKDEIFLRSIEIMEEYFNLKYATKLSQIALKSLLFEINTTPKPGLVDLNNNGSHRDLNVYLFQQSAICLQPFFTKFVYVGINNKDETLTNIFLKLRSVGKKAEYDMFKATDNINTHKGAIFIFSLILCVLGWLYANDYKYSRSRVEKSIKELSEKVLDDFLFSSQKEKLTHGEEIYSKYNILGVRGEAATGFHSAFTTFITCFNQQLKTHSFNDSGVYTLLKIIMSIDDTNIISRSDFETNKYYKEKIEKTLNSEKVDIIKFASLLDKEFISKGISAGGSADLLALTYFLYFYENEVI